MPGIMNVECASVWKGNKSEIGNFCSYSQRIICILLRIYLHTHIYSECRDIIYISIAHIYAHMKYALLHTHMAG